MKKLRILIIVLPGFFAGCAGYNTTMFMTKSNAGLDIDMKPPTAEINISRKEAVIEPVFEKGQTPPVMASFKPNVHFGGAAGSQDLETIRIGDMFYQRAAGGAWQENAGAGPILGTLSQLDPQRLCDQTIAQINVSNIKPVADTIDGVKTEHYSFGPADLAGSPGLFGQGGERNRGNASPQNTRGRHGCAKHKLPRPNFCLDHRFGRPNYAQRR